MTRQYFRGALAATAGWLSASGSALAGVTVYFVDDDAPPGGDGTTWATAFDDLQDALGVAGPGDEIRLGQGRYAPSHETIAGDERSASFLLGSGLDLLGGFAGRGAPDPDARDIDAFETVLSGDLDGDDGPDFENDAENAYRVVQAIGLDETAVLDGVTIRGGHNESGDAVDRGAGLFAESSCVILRNVTCRGNRAFVGGGVLSHGAELTLVDCDLSDNSGDASGGMEARYESTVTATRCRWTGNTAAGGGGLICADGSALTLVDCEFRANTAEHCAAILITDSDAVAVNVIFAENVASFISGGTLIGESFEPVDATFINCVWSRNTADGGGGVYTNTDPIFVNCSFSQNGGGAVMYDTNGTPELVNCVLWDNPPIPIIEDPAHPGGAPTVRYSDVQGGWSGAGIANIDADPLFVQPGADDLRLGIGSPCLELGDLASLPADALDLDGDGDTAEPVPVDLAGGPRVLGRTVDMGAYEGAFALQPPAAYDGDVDEGDGAVLVPNGTAWDPLNSSMMVFVNETGGDDGEVLAEAIASDIHPENGYTEISEIFGAQTTVIDGAFFSTVYIPFEGADVPDADPLDLEMSCFDAATGRWAAAVSGNAVNSPGHPVPIGDRVEAIGPGPWGVTPDLGDFGVHWDPGQDRGFVWANVDHDGDFAVGVDLCPSDIAPVAGDGAVDVADLTALIIAWTADPTGAHADVNRDGAVDVLDLARLLEAWGACP